MKRPFKWDKMYLHWGVTAFCVIACAILFYMALNYLGLLWGAAASLVRILSPFIWGLVLSYLLSPFLDLVEKKVFSPLFCKPKKKKNAKDGKKLARSFSVLASEVLLLLIIAALVYLIIPQLYLSIQTIVANSSDYVESVTKWAEKFLQDYPQLEIYVTSNLSKLTENVTGWLTEKVLPSLGSFVSNITAGVVYVLKGVYNVVVGIFVSIYILGNKENFSAGCRRLLYTLFKTETSEKILKALSFTDKTFIGFINGKLLDSAIIGFICYIFCAITNMPYALLVSVIVGVTNVIPFFGPFIGAIPSALIILLLSPIKCLIFVIFIIILQQLDGNFIGPKILGSTIGISGFWVMFSIILGAGLFGFWGMLLGVPVFVVIQAAVEGLVVRKLKSRDLPCELDNYRKDKINSTQEESKTE